MPGFGFIVLVTPLLKETTCHLIQTQTSEMTDMKPSVKSGGHTVSSSQAWMFLEHDVTAEHWAELPEVLENNENTLICGLERWLSG